MAKFKNFEQVQESEIRRLKEQVAQLQSELARKTCDRCSAVTDPENVSPKDESSDLCCEGSETWIL